MIRRILPRPSNSTFEETRSCGVLLEFGPAIIPNLARELQNGNTGVRLVSAEVLALFGRSGKDLGAVRPELLKALRDANPEVVHQAALALQFTRTRHE